MSQENSPVFNPEFAWLKKYYKTPHLSPIELPSREMFDIFSTIDSAYEILGAYQGLSMTIPHTTGSTKLDFPYTEHSLLNSRYLIVGGDFTPAIDSHASVMPRSEEFFLFLEGSLLHILYSQTYPPHTEVPPDLPFINITWHKRNPRQNVFEENSPETVVLHKLAFYIEALQAGKNFT